MKLLTIICFFLLTAQTNATVETNEAWQIASKISEPEIHLKNLGKLVVLGNSAISEANIIFLPEVHDDPDSLLVQLLVLAREKKNAKPFIVLDESLASMKKSMWDIFSEKSLEIIAAKSARQNGGRYVPREFEVTLQRLAKKFQEIPGQLSFLENPGIWTLADFKSTATPFYGWDLRNKASLLERNIEMVATLKKTLRNHDRVLVMAGARHIPDLEFLISQKLLCEDNRSKDIDQYFSRLEQKFGATPNLRFGIGATAPIYNFLTTKRYAVVFNKDLFSELNQVIKQFKNQDNDSCMQL